MRKLVTCIILFVAVLSVSGQPDTIIDGVSFRKELRQAVNWNILTNADQIDSLQKHRIDINNNASDIAGKEDALTNEASLYATLSDVSRFLEEDDQISLLTAPTWRLFYSDGSGDIHYLLLGTEGQVLTSNGASAAPAFEDPAIALDQIDDPTGNGIINLGNYTQSWNFTNPAGGMLYSWEGAASGNLFELNQHTGNPGLGTHLLHLEASDDDIVGLYINYTGITPDTALFVDGPVKTTATINDVGLFSGNVKLLDDGYMYWGNTNLRIEGDYDNQDIDFYSGGNPKFRIQSDAIHCFVDLLPFGSGENIGRFTGDFLFEDIIAGNRFYLKTPDTYIDTSNNELLLHDAVNGNQLLSDLKVADSAIYVSCPANSTTDLTIGDDGDLSFVIHYQCYRDISGKKHQAGTIKILYDPDQESVSCLSSYLGTDIGLDIEADESGGDLRLNVIVDNTNANPVYFDWKFYSKFY